MCLEINGWKRIKVPEKGSTVRLSKKQQVPFIILADIKAITKKIQKYYGSDGRSYTDKYQKHIDCDY